MTRTLVVGLGNPLAGDDGVGWHVATRLTGHPRLPPDTEVLEGGTDLLRLQGQLCGRDRVFLVDAVLDDGPPGQLLVLDDDAAPDTAMGSAHQLSPTAALRILRAACPDLRTVPVTLLGVTIRGVRVRPELSPELSDRLDAVVDGVVDAVLADRGRSGPTAADTLAG